MSDAFVGSRLEYARDGLDLDHLDPDPLTQLRRWLEDAASEGVLEPSAMCLATVGPDRQPSARMVLMRGLDARGLTFYTNYLSRKGRDLEACPMASACFWWGPLERQVRVEGTVEKLSAEESDSYFNDRPLASRRASAASPQSQPVESREALERLLEGLPEVATRPDYWGGYLLRPRAIEFWQGRPARLHDRFLYTLAGETWTICRLAP